MAEAAIRPYLSGVPTILRVAGYRFFFFSNERNEPAHIHVEQAERYAKFWLAPTSVAANYGFEAVNWQSYTV
jgi:hypothetical protein